MHDVIIVGGSYAGLPAALQLGRARRSVLVLDGGIGAHQSLIFRRVGARAEGA